MSENADSLADALENAYELERNFRGLSLPCDKYDLNPSWFRNRFSVVNQDRNRSKLMAKQSLIMEFTSALESYDGDPSLVSRFTGSQDATSIERDEQTTECAENIQQAYSSLVQEIENEQPSEA